MVTGWWYLYTVASGYGTFLAVAENEKTAISRVFSLYTRN